MLMLSLPYILVLLGNLYGNCCVHDPAENYKVVFSSATYNEAQTWLLEDEYEPVEERLSASELSVLCDVNHHSSLSGQLIISSSVIASSR